LTLDKTSSSQIMKSMNQQKVLSVIYQNEFISRVEIAEKVGLTQQTITNIVTRLIKDGVVIEAKDPTFVSNTGRKPIPLRINSSNLYAIGIEVAKKHIRGVLTDFSRNILAETEIAFEGFGSRERTFKGILHVSDLLINKCANPKQIKGIGVSVPGLIDQSQGIVLKAEDFHWVDFKLREELEQRYDYPVYIENDVNMMGVVENATGILSASQDNITVMLDQGIGGAIVVQKKLYSGYKNVAGELGHVKVIYGKDALLCKCGSFGCLTTVASIGGLEEKLGADFKEIIKRLQSGEQQIIDTFNSIAEAIGNALSNIVTFFNPDHVLLTGRLIEMGGAVLVPIIEERIQQTTTAYCREVIIKSTILSDGAKMASSLVRKETFNYL
jgi:predicted NBD/HSP70 family sugar kinase/biotin operon repressor